MTDFENGPNRYSEDNRAVMKNDGNGKIFLRRKSLLFLTGAAKTARSAGRIGQFFRFFKIRI